nr:dTDP-4-dehydrorhamnose reductase [Sphingomonas arenae]
MLITGREGQLARSLVERAAEVRGLEVHAIGRPELDLEQPGRAAAVIREIRPDLVVNAAAYTAVDQAEQEPERAFRVNADGAGEVAAAAREVGARVIQISTDYVFPGLGEWPWRPDDATGPLNVYGASKLAGEEQVRAANPEHLVLRTSWVFGGHGRNFVSTMLRLARERDVVRVVDDQRGCPTPADDLADAILAVAERWRAGGSEGLGETMHVAGAGPCSWAEFASAIFAVSAAQAGPSAEVVPIPSSEFPTPARRPMFSVLDCGTFEREFNWPMRRWSDALPEVVARLLRDPA